MILRALQGFKSRRVVIKPRLGNKTPVEAGWSLASTSCGLIKLLFNFSSSNQTVRTSSPLSGLTWSREATL